MDELFDKAWDEYQSLPSVDTDALRFKNISDLVFGAQTELDLDDDGDIELTREERNKILAFVNKYRGATP